MNFPKTQAGGTGKMICIVRPKIMFGFFLLFVIISYSGIPPKFSLQFFYHIQVPC